MRKFKHNGSEYIDLGEQNGKFRIYKPSSKSIDLLSKNEYMNMIM